MSEKLYTQHDLDIELLKNNENHIFKILERLEHKIDSHFHWTIGAVSVLYLALFGTLVSALAKSLHWF